MGKIADFSYHQGSINWTMAATDLDLAIIRVQYGSSFIDPKYKEYVAGCKKNNIPFGHYAYCKFVSKADAVKEAQDFHERADKDARFLVADVEEQTTPKVTDMAPATQAFIDTLKAKGWKVGLYTGNHTYADFGMQRVTADFLWIPRYGSQRPVYACDIWQYTDKGKVLGVTGNVDLNQLIGTKMLAYFTGKTPIISPAPVTLLDYLKAKGIDSSEGNRKKLAKEYGVANYDLSAAKNQELLAALQRGVKVPTVDGTVAISDLQKLQSQIAVQAEEIANLKKQLAPKTAKDPDPAHAEAWKWAKEQGLLNGERPLEPVTREQLATILKRLKG